MVSNNLQMLLVLATVLIVYESSLSPFPSSCHVMAVEVTAAEAMATSLKTTEMDLNLHSHHINKPSIDGTGTGSIKRLTRHIAQGQQHQQQQQNQNADVGAEAGNSIKRSYSSSAPSNGGHGFASTLNGLTSLSSLQHIRSGAGSAAGYGYDAPSSTGLTHFGSQQPAMYTEAKPIYEDQQEHDYGASSASSSQQHQQHYGLGDGSEEANAALHSAIYNLQTAGTHNAGRGAGGFGSTNNGGSDGFRPSWNFGKLSTSFTASTVASTPYSSYHTGGKGGGAGAGFSAGNAVDSSGSSSNNDKISEGNFLHHYDSASGYNELTQLQQHHQQQQQQESYQPQYESQYEYGAAQQHHQRDDYNYNSVEQAAESSSSYGGEESQHHHDHSNYLPSAPPSGAGPSGGGGGVGGGHHEEKQPDVINYVPYPVVKKLHVPVHEPVQIPVSHAVIIPIKKPVPIHIPITQNVQVPIEKDLKIPVERIVPYPVEKHVPVPVEKRVPYEVIKYVPIKVARPFPVKVPVFKTVLHKVKGWW